MPTFVNTDELTKALRDQGVVLNARPPDSGRNPLLTLLLAFGPTILIVAPADLADAARLLDGRRRRAQQLHALARAARR